MTPDEKKPNNQREDRSQEKPLNNSSNFDDKRGYIPTEGNIDKDNPPQGGSGVNQNND